MALRGMKLRAPGCDAASEGCPVYFPIQVQPGMRRPQIPWTLNRSYYGTPSEALQVTPGHEAAIPLLCLLQMAQTMRHAF
jgi:hypothetical protein